MSWGEAWPAGRQMPEQVALRRDQRDPVLARYPHPNYVQVRPMGRDSARWDLIELHPQVILRNGFWVIERSRLPEVRRRFAEAGASGRLYVRRCPEPVAG